MEQAAARVSRSSSLTQCRVYYLESRKQTKSRLHTNQNRIPRRLPREVLRRASRTQNRRRHGPPLPLLLPREHGVHAGARNPFRHHFTHAPRRLQKVDRPNPLPPEHVPGLLKLRRLLGDPDPEPDRRHYHAYCRARDQKVYCARPRIQTEI